MSTTETQATALAPLEVARQQMELCEERHSYPLHECPSIYCILAREVIRLDAEASLLREERDDARKSLAQATDAHCDAWQKLNAALEALPKDANGNAVALGQQVICPQGHKVQTSLAKQSVHCCEGTCWDTFDSSGTSWRINECRVALSGTPEDATASRLVEEKHNIDSDGWRVI